MGAAAIVLAALAAAPLTGQQCVALQTARTFAGFSVGQWIDGRELRAFTCINTMPAAIVSRDVRLEGFDVVLLTELQEGIKP